VASVRRFRFGAQVAYASAGNWATTARRVEELGYSTLLMPDHFDDQLAPVPALAAAAAATTTLRVGSLVFDNDYRHPLVLAKETATLDALSGGRFELGLGAGWQRSDYEQSGIPYDPAVTRVDRLAEALAVVKGLWAGGCFSHTGRHYRITNHPGTPRPVQRPRPPILLGGGSRQVLSLAGREADIVNVNFDLRSGTVGSHLGASATEAATKEKLCWVRDGAGRRFDELELGVTVYVAAVTDARDDVAAGIGRGFGLSAKDVLGTPHFLVGTLDEMADDLEHRRAELGFSYIAFSGGSWPELAPLVDRLAGT
jgi:probable F420-dependent oxidoreductase